MPLKSTSFFFLLILCLWFNVNSCIAQTYYTLLAQGKIYHDKERSYLRTGDTVQAQDTLTFSSPEAWIILVGDQGTVFLQQPEDKKSKALCQQAIQPITNNRKATNRKEKNVDNLQTYFEGEQFVFIGNDFKLSLNPETYPLSDSLFLLYRYEYNERHITIKIPYQTQTLFFDPEVLYTYKGEKIPPSQTTNTGLYLFNAIDNMPYTAAKLNPIWLKEEKIKAELSVLKKFYTSKGKTWSDIQPLCLAYILDVYGKTDEPYCLAWLDEHLK